MIRTEKALNTSVKLTSITGQPLLDKEFRPSAQPHQLDLSALPAGVYVVNMQTGNMFSAKKIIKK